MKKRQQKVKLLCECAMMVALATVLSMVKIYEAPLGGSVTLFSMVPIIICGYVHGVKAGFATAFVYSAIQLLFGIGTVAYVPDALGILLCIFLDYIIAFSAMGVASLTRRLRFFKKEETNLYFNVALGSLAALLIRFLCHILSGAVVWYTITKEGMWNEEVFKYGKWMYSVVYNSAFMVPEIILTLVAVPVAVALIRMVWGKMLKKERDSLEEGVDAPVKTKSMMTSVVFLLFGIALLLGGILFVVLAGNIALDTLGIVLGLLGLVFAVKGLLEKK